VTLSNPSVLWLLWLLPAFAALGWLANRRRREALSSFADERSVQRLLPPEPALRRWVRGGLLGLALVGLIASLAGPRWGFRWEEVQRRGVDLVVALDLSRSMLAEDATPNRLTAAKREIRDLVDLLQGDRVGLVVFAGVAFTQVPLTLDYGAFEVFLDQMSPSWVPIGGTDLSGAVLQAIETFAEGERAGRALLLITDGEDHSGRLRSAAAEAKKQGVHVFVVGLGAPEGAPVPDGQGGFIKENGTVVLSRLDEPALKELAISTGGSYVRGVAGDLDLRRIYLQDIKGTLEARELSSSRQKRWEERFQWFLLPALLLLVFEGLLGTGRRMAPAGLALLLALGATAPRPAMAGLFGSDDPARTGYDAFGDGQFEAARDAWIQAQVADPTDRRLDYNIGQAHFALQAFADAEQAFLAASATDRNELAADALHNAGNAAFQQGKYLEAVAHYEASLELRPDDADSAANRDLAQRRYEELLEQSQQDQEQQEQQEQQQDPSEQNPNDEEQQDEQEQSDESQESAENQEQKQQEQQSGSADKQQQQEQQGEQGEQGEQPPDEPTDGQAEGQPDEQSDSQQQEQEQPEATQEQGEKAEAADIDRDAEARPEDADGQLAQETEPGDDPNEAGEAGEVVPVEGAMDRQQAESLLRALEADQARRRKERTEREAKGGSRAAGKDW